MVMASPVRLTVKSSRSDENDVTQESMRRTLKRWHSIDESDCKQRSNSKTAISHVNATTSLRRIVGGKSCRSVGGGATGMSIHHGSSHSRIHSQRNTAVVVASTSKDAANMPAKTRLRDVLLVLSHGGNSTSTTATCSPTKKNLPQRADASSNMVKPSFETPISLDLDEIAPLSAPPLVRGVRPHVSDDSLTYSVYSTWTSNNSNSHGNTACDASVSSLQSSQSTHSRDARRALAKKGMTVRNLHPVTATAASTAPESTAAVSLETDRRTTSISYQTATETTTTTTTVAESLRQSLGRWNSRAYLDDFMNHTSGTSGSSSTTQTVSNKSRKSATRATARQPPSLLSSSSPACNDNNDWDDLDEMLRRYQHSESKYSTKSSTRCRPGGGGQELRLATRASLTRSDDDDTAPSSSTHTEQTTNVGISRAAVHANPVLIPPRRALSLRVSSSSFYGNRRTNDVQWMPSTAAAATATAAAKRNDVEWQPPCATDVIIIPTSVALNSKGETVVPNDTVMNALLSGGGSNDGSYESDSAAAADDDEMLASVSSFLDSPALVDAITSQLVQNQARDDSEDKAAEAGGNDDDDHDDHDASFYFATLQSDDNTNDVDITPPPSSPSIEDSGLLLFDVATTDWKEEVIPSLLLSSAQDDDKPVQPATQATDNKDIVEPIVLPDPYGSAKDDTEQSEDLYIGTAPPIVPISQSVAVPTSQKRAKAATGVVPANSRESKNRRRQQRPPPNRERSMVSAGGAMVIRVEKCRVKRLHRSRSEASVLLEV